jgi:hypothetical protein
MQYVSVYTHGISSSIAIDLLIQIKGAHILKTWKDLRWRYVVCSGFLVKMAAKRKPSAAMRVDWMIRSTAMQKGTTDQP